MLARYWLLMLVIFASSGQSQLSTLLGNDGVPWPWLVLRLLPIVLLMME